MLRLRNPRRAFAAVVLVVTSLLTACGVGTQTTSVAVRLFDAVPGSGPTDFSISGATFVTGLNYKDVTTYGTISSGNNEVQGVASGTTTFTVPPQTLSFTHQAQTLVAAGIPGSTATPPMLFNFVDANNQPPNNQLRIRFINASPDAGPVDFSFAGQVVATDVPYGMAGSAGGTAYATVKGATGDLTATKTGTSTVEWTRPAVQLSNGHVYTIVLEGQVGVGTAAIIAQEDV